MKKALLLVLMMAVCAATALAQGKNPANLDKKDMKPAVELKNLADSASYAWGQVLATSIKRQAGEDFNEELFYVGLRAAMAEDSLLFSNEQANQVYSGYVRKMQQIINERFVKTNTAYLENNKKRNGVTVTASGLQYEVMKRGTSNVQPGPTSKVKVHYHGTNIDGTVFDSSVERNQPIEFGLNQVIKGWTEGVQLMRIGDKFRFVIPAELAYGDRSPSPKIKANSTLIFEVELLDITQ